LSQKPGLPQKSGAKGSAALLDARALEEAERQDRHRNETLAENCGEVEEDLEALRARYDLYFIGVERREPAREREEMKRRVARLKGEFTRNTGLRFRIETLHARYISYERMWVRSAREKESGTYRRDIMRARRKAELQAKREAAQAAEAGEGRPSAAPPPVVPAATATREAPLPEAPVPPPSAVAPRAPAQEAPSQAPAGARPATPAPGGFSEAQLRTLYDAYVAAKVRCKEDVSRLTYDALAKTVARQVPELMAKYKATAVEFKVVIKEGRAVLKAVPRL